MWDVYTNSRQDRLPRFWPEAFKVVYKALTPGLYSWPSLPDGMKIEHSSEAPSKYDTTKLLLRLNIDEKNVEIDKNKINAVVGQTHQQFLARIGAIEVEDERKSQFVSISQRFTLLPWMDGIARLVLILGFEDELAISRAAKSTTDASINEHMQISFKEVGVVKHLVRLLNHNNDSVKFDVTCVLERLSVNNSICQLIEAKGVTMCPMFYGVAIPSIIIVS